LSSHETIAEYQLGLSMVEEKRLVWDHRSLVTIGCCIFCTSQNSTQVACRQDGLPLLHCPNCDLAYIDPRPSPEQLRNYYDSGYFQGQKDFFAGSDYCEMRDRAITDKAITGYGEIISNFDLAGKSILDIGCGSGALLKLVSLHDPAQVIGIDVAEYPLAYGRSRYGLDLRQANLAEVGFPSESFDIVLMIDLIEHVEDLPNFLREVARVLRPGGCVFLMTPNYAAFSRAGSSWICLQKDFEHLQYLSPGSLARMAATVYLRVVRWWTNGIPMSLSSYPALYPRGLHRVFHPVVSLSNLSKKLRHALVTGMRHDSGLYLYAILNKDASE
jgi:2-polyprenyl-3-methyl-5-hydroxy-6-metoxy-1,4-benzoquinol methylase